MEEIVLPFSIVVLIVFILLILQEAFSFFKDLMEYFKVKYLYVIGFFFSFLILFAAVIERKRFEYKKDCIEITIWEKNGEGINSIITEKEAVDSIKNVFYNTLKKE